MAEKKTTKKTPETTSKKVVKDPKKDVLVSEAVIDLVANQNYKFISNGRGGMQKDRVYVVSGIVAGTLLKNGLGKIVE